MLSIFQGLTMANLLQDSIPFDDHWLYPCAICYKTISEIYQGSGNHHGLTQDYYEANKHQIMRLWLTQCGHLVCGAHFRDGGMFLDSPTQHKSLPCLFFPALRLISI
jgi:hypothetical protein